MSTVTRTTDPHGRVGLTARLRARAAGHVTARLAALRAGKERGDALVDTLIAMAVIGTTVCAFGGNYLAANEVQRSTLAIDVVSQQAAGILERAQGQPWALLGFNTTTIGYRAADVLNRATVVVASAPSATALEPVTDDIVTRGVVMDQRVDITWDGYTSATPPGSYGTKVITVTITYTVPGTGTTLTKTFSAKRTSSVAEAIPSTLGTLAAADRTAIVEPGPATICPVVTRSGTTLSWPAVKGATKGYRVRQTYNGTTTDFNVTGTSWTNANVGAAGYTHKVLAVFADNGESSGC